MAFIGYSKGYYFCAYCYFFGLGVKQDINNGLSLFCYLQDINWNNIYYFLGSLFFKTNFYLEKNLSHFVQSPSIALEFFELYLDTKVGYLNQSEEFQENFQILLNPNES
jgi:TPR repeat protein